jgi:Tfp pilus assembly protein PilN
MINLIPHKGQTALKHEYLLRVASVYGFLLAGVFLASTALIVPTYVLTSTQLSTAQDDGSSIDETRIAFDAAFGEIKVANTVMAQLRKPQDNIAHSDVIQEIVKVAPRGVSFTTFQMERIGTDLKEVRVQGTAENRIALSSFKTALESSPLFLQALVPIADLARNSDLPFVITITLEEPIGENVVPTP